LNELPFRFTAKAVTRFVVTFAVLYGAAFTLYWSTPVFGVVHRVFIGTTTAALQLAGGKVSYQMHLHDDPLIPFTYRTIHITAVAPGVHRDFHIMGQYGTNLAVFLALVLASPGLTWRARAASLAAGSGVIMVINTLVMLGTVWTFQAQYAELQPLLPGGPGGAVLLLARMAYQLSPTGGLYMLPVFLWGFVLLSSLVSPAPVRAATVRRNDAAAG
jgi:hypothetical protein